MPKFTVHVMNADMDSYGDAVFTTDNYDAAIAYADSIATKPVYYAPDPDGTYVVIFDGNHDSPRYTSW